MVFLSVLQKYRESSFSERDKPADLWVSILAKPLLGYESVEPYLPVEVGEPHYIFHLAKRIVTVSLKIFDLSENLLRWTPESESTKVSMLCRPADDGGMIVPESPKGGEECSHRYN